MSSTELKKELRKLDKDMIIDLVTDLYKRNKSVKEFLDFYINPDEKALFNKYRTKIFEAFYPKRGNQYKLKDGKQAISDFRKIGSSADLVADLMLFYVETGVKFTNEFGEIDEGFYISMASTYAAALTLMKKESLLEQFAARARKVVSDASDTGYGLPDDLVDRYARFYANYLDDKK